MTARLVVGVTKRKSDESLRYLELLGHLEQVLQAGSAVPQPYWLSASGGTSADAACVRYGPVLERGKTMIDGEKEHIEALVWLVKEGWANWSDRAELANYKQVYPELVAELEKAA